MDTVTLAALWRQCAPPTRPWHSDAGESAMLHLRMAHYLRHLTLQLHDLLHGRARVRWRTYDQTDGSGHALCGITIAPMRDGDRPITLDWVWNAPNQYGVIRCPQLDVATQPIALGARDTDIDRSLLALLPPIFVFLHGLLDAVPAVEPVQSIRSV